MEFMEVMVEVMVDMVVMIILTHPHTIHTSTELTPLAENMGMEDTQDLFTLHTTRTEMDTQLRVRT